MLKRFFINWSNQTEAFDPDGWAVYADDALLVIAELEAHIEDRERHIQSLHENADYFGRYVNVRIAELEAHLEDRERTIGTQVSELVAYERWVNEFAATVDAQHTTIETLNAHIAELETNYKEIARDQLAIAQALTDVGIEHSGYKKQAERVAMLIERLRTSQRNVIAFAKDRNDAQQRVAELETQLAAALATIEAAATGDEWQDRPLTYIAVENSQLGTWGIEDHLGGILYESDMTQPQAEALAIAHNAGVEGFDKALDWLQARGIDWATFATGKEYVEGCKP
jgi:uncharacterized coiled-coil protein SlyX